MSTLVKRILSALVMLPVVVAALWYGGWAFYALMVAVFGISVQEWSRLSLRNGRIDWGLLIAGVAYLATACLCAAWLRTDEAWGFYLVLYVFLAVWACDIGAYTVGKIVGGPKMAPKVSPNKTWAGLVGGCAAAVAAVMLYDAWLGTRTGSPVIEHFSLFFQFTLGLLLAVVGQLGDLMISVLKRKCGLKDTGNIIPGHGGLLDRIDALLLTIPVYTVSVLYLEYLLT
jgi:phosphatidate cytidylyltransferase